MKRVAVLRGGPSEEYDVSLTTGAVVLEVLRSLDYEYKDIVITKTGEWLEFGVVKAPERALEGVDVAFLALHGQYGEDGKVQRILERLHIPFTGSRALSSGIAFNKELTKQSLMHHHILMPRHRTVQKFEKDRIREEVAQIISDLGSDLFVKPIASGSSIGVVRAQNEVVLQHSLEQLLETYDKIMVEQAIVGKEATVGVLSNFRGEPLYALPAVEVVPPTVDTFYTYKNKYDGSSALVCPGRFSYAEKTKLAEAAMLVHKEIGCDQYSRSDFIVKDGEVYFLEVNTLPGLTKHSNFPHAAESVGLDYPSLISHLVETATV